MRKVVLGFVLGVIMAMASPVAGDTVIGKQVQTTFPLIIDGVRATRNVIVVDSTSYLPVRAAGEIFGYNVDFINNQVVLERKSNTVENREYKSYPVRSNTYNIGEPEMYYMENGEWYFPAYQTFGAYISRAGEQWIVTLPNRDPVPALIEAARIWIKLSDLGIKPELRDGVLWLD